jgi:hypothetical protein
VFQFGGNLNHTAPTIARAAVRSSRADFKKRSEWENGRDRQAWAYRPPMAKDEKNRVPIDPALGY